MSPDAPDAGTDEKQREFDLIEHAPCGVVSFSDDGTIQYVNRTLADRLGYKVSDLTGRHVERLFGVGTRIFYQTHFFPLLRLHGRAQEIFMLLRTSGGEDVGMLCNAVRHDRRGAFVADCVLMEVQERRKFEDALLHARKVAEEASAQLAIRAEEAEEASAELEAQGRELELLNEELQEQRAAADKANEAKSSFLAVMSHELRTPLNAIGGYVQLLDLGIHGPVTDAQREALARIDRSQRHLLRLINEVLNLARIEAGHVDYAVEVVPIDAIIDSVLPMIEPQLGARELTLTRETAPGLCAHGDRDKVQQILLNLLTNAVKFTNAGGTITVSAGGHDDVTVFLRVQDSGTGIPVHMLDRIFEPFIQVKTSAQGSGEGTGLGLAISRDLARGMKGDLCVESEIGVGSTFELLLQRAPANNATPP